jgi:flagellar biosynthesis chaperone FliJ
LDKLLKNSKSSGAEEVSVRTVQVNQFVHQLHKLLQGVNNEEEKKEKKIEMEGENSLLSML